MPYFLILADDRADALKVRLAHRQRHIDYWTGMPGVVKVAGAMLESEQPCGSSFLIEAADYDTARALVAGDPFTEIGVFSGDTRIIAVRPAIGEWLPAS